ncbi:MAG: PDZ domain-containing protein, partial [Verrucomicrobiota bacterium]
MVNDILRTPAVEAKIFDKERDTQIWPFPENVGLTVDRDHGLLVKQVTPNSPAARAGLKPGDVLGAAGGRLLFSQADFRGVLHRGPKGAGNIDLVWLRAGKPMTGTLAVADGWRKTVLDWRMSISQGVIGAGPSFFPLNVSDAKRKQFNLTGKMAVAPYLGNNTTSPAYQAGLRNNSIVTAVNGKSPDVSGRGFLVWFRKNFEPGDTATFSYLDGNGQPRTATFKLTPKDH